MADDTAQTLAEVKADADDRGIPDTPMGTSVLHTNPDDGVLMTDVAVDPSVAALVESDESFVQVPDYTDEEILSVVANAIGYEVFRADGRPVEVLDGGVESIKTTDEENKVCARAAQRVLSDLAIARHPFADLRRLQDEQAAWSARNFVPIDPPGHVAALGMGEESGELAEAMAEALSGFAFMAAVGKVLHFQLKGEQSIRYTPEEIKAKKADAAADALIYLVDFCTRNDIDLADVVRDTWTEVSARDWAADPINAAAIAKAGMPAPKLGEDVAHFEAGMRVRCTQDTTYKEGDGSTTISTIIVEEGDRGTIDSIDPDGTIRVAWDSLVGPREVLYADIEPIGHSVERERPDVIHYADHYGSQVSEVGTGLDEALAQGGVIEGDD